MAPCNFFTMIYISVINGHIIYHVNSNVTVLWYSFLKKLSQDLIRNQQVTRVANPKVHPELKTLIKELKMEQEENRTEQEEDIDCEKCYFCPWKRKFVVQNVNSNMENSLYQLALTVLMDKNNLKTTTINRICR